MCRLLSNPGAFLPTRHYRLFQEASGSGGKWSRSRDGLAHTSARRKSTFGKAAKIDTNTHRAPIPSPPSELSLAVRLGIVAHAHNPTWVEHYEGHKSQANMDQAPPR